LIAVVLLIKKRVFDEYSLWEVPGIKIVCNIRFAELDSTKRYDLFINLRITTIINTTISDWSVEKPNHTKVDTFISNVEPDGTLLGNGFTDIKKVSCFKENVNSGENTKSI
jgi:hypothetical protein